MASKNVEPPYLIPGIESTNLLVYDQDSIMAESQPLLAGLSMENSFGIYPLRHERFILDPYSGWLSLNDSLDAEMDPNITLKVKAIDHGQPAMTSTATIIITVVDYNDNSPMFSQLSYQTQGNYPILSQILYQTQDNYPMDF